MIELSGINLDLLCIQSSGTSIYVQRAYCLSSVKFLSIYILCSSNGLMPLFLLSVLVE